jgi:hypothetical protein
MDHERILAASPFPGDDGQASARTRARLAEVVGSANPAAYLSAIVALCEDRVLVPVVATATRVGTTVGGLTSDKEAEMSVVMLQAADGRRAMLAFTGLDSLQSWESGARPVPITIDRAAQTALAEGVAAILIDVAGPYPLALDGEVLNQLAAGHRLVELAEGEFGWAMAADS